MNNRIDAATWCKTRGTLKRFIFVFAAAMATLSWGVDRPANDDFANATSISGAPGSATGTTIGATYEEGEPLKKYRTLATNTVWWAWTAPCNGTATFTTKGSYTVPGSNVLDTVMGVYTGTLVSDLAVVKENDDAASSERTSLCKFTAVAGTRYCIAIAPRSTTSGDNEGTIMLSWSIVPDEGSTFSLTTDPNGGTYNGSSAATTVAGALTYNFDDSSDIGVPVRAGQTFVGWFTAADGGEMVYDASGRYVVGGYWTDSGLYHYAGDLSVYAQWSGSSFSLTRDPNGGTYQGKTAATTVANALTYGSGSYWSIGVPTRANHKFLGWFDAASGGNKVYDEEGKCVAGEYWDADRHYCYSGNLAVYAQWVTDGTPFNLTIDPNGGKYDGSDAATTVAGALKYHLSGDSSSIPFAEQTGPINTDDRLVFVGWTNSVGEIVYDATGMYVAGTYWDEDGRYMHIGDLTVYAKWVDKTGKDSWLTIDPTGGSYDDVSYRQMKFGEESNNEIKKPEYNPYEFLGWFTETAGGDMVYDKTGKFVPGTYWDKDGLYIHEGDITVYARWKAPKYDLARDPNGGTYQGKTAAFTSANALTYGSGSYWSIGVPTRTGYTFTGWFDAADGGNMVYDASGKCVAGGDYWDADRHYSHDGNLAVYAQWTADSFDLTTDPNGGTYKGSGTSTTASGALTYDAGDGSDIGVSKRTGYAFAGWFDAATGGNMVYDVSGKCVEGDYWTADGRYRHNGGLTVYAQWVGEFTLALDPNGGTYKGSADATSIANALVPNATNWKEIDEAPVRADYGFLGWYDAAEGGKLVYDASGRYVAGSYWTADGRYRLTEDLAVYAQWSDDGSFTLIRNPNGGTYQGKTSAVVVTNALVYGDGRYNDIRTPERAGYEFTGWFTAADGGEMVYDASGKCVAGEYWDADKHYIKVGDLTVYAQWSAPKYTATFDANGGVGGTTKTQEYGTSLEAPTVSRTGYEFAGWKPAVPATMPAYNQTYVAQWDAPKYALTRDPNGGVYLGKTEATTAADALTYGSGNSSDIGVPTRTGYAFAGWFDAATDGNMVYDVSGKCVAGDYWTAEGNYRYSGDLTVYAQWSDGFALTVDPNGGTYKGKTEATSIANALAYYSTEWKELDEAPVRDGWGFLGWFDSATGGEMVYDASCRYVAGTYWTADGRYRHVGDLTVYAQWSDDCYTLIVDPAGGTYQGKPETTIATKALTYGSEDNSDIGVPTRTGYVFTGWFDADGVQVYDASGKCVEGDYWDGYKRYINVGDLTVYAKWAVEGAKYTLTRDPAGGKYLGKTEATVVAGALKYDSTAYCDIGAPERFGYVFSGWFTADGVMVYDVEGRCVAGDYWTEDGRYRHSGELTVYAHWSAGFTLTIDPAGGTYKGKTDATVAAGVLTNDSTTAYSDIDVPVRDGWGFLGWFAADGTAVYDASGAYVTGDYWTADGRYRYIGDLTVYAQWSDDRFTLVRNPNGGTYLGRPEETVAAGVLSYGSGDYWSIGVPSRTGYSFAGWFTVEGVMAYGIDGNCVIGDYWDEYKRYKHAGDLVVYALWASPGRKYDLTRDPNGGKYQGKTTAVKATGALEYGAGAYWEIGVPTRTGYSFVGWYDAATGGNMVYDESGKCVTGDYWDAGKHYINEGNLTVYAHWSTGFSLTIDPNGGTYNGETAATSIAGALTYYSTASNAIDEAPVREGWGFLGWFAADGTAVYDASGAYVTGDYWTADGRYRSSGDLTVYAQWSDSRFTLIRDPNGGTYLGKTTVVTAAGVLSYGSGDYWSIGVPSRAGGYTFTGWYDAETGGNMVYDAEGKCVAGDYWTADKYYCYVGDLKVYARWASPGAKYDLTRDPNGGTYQGNTTAVKATGALEYGAGAYWEIGVPTRTGYSFAGWYDAATGGNMVYDASGKCVAGGYWDSDKHYINSGNLTVYAHWSTWFSLTIDPNGGTYKGGTAATSIAEALAYYSTAGNAIEGMPEREGWGFLGWFAADGTAVYDASGKYVAGSYWTADGRYRCSGDLTVYAQWSDTRFTLTRNPNGGTYQGRPEATIAVGVLSYGSGDYWEIGTPEHTDAKQLFLGWFTKDGEMVYDDEGKCVAGGSYWDGYKRYSHVGDLTVYAYWTNRYVLTRDPNGGTYQGKTTATVVPGAMEYDAGYYWSIGTPERGGGYTFSGWFDAETGGNMVYDEKGNCVAGDYWTADKHYIHVGHLTVYAQWNAPRYDLTRDPNNGTYQGKTTAIKSEDALAYGLGYYWEIGTPSRSGYTFAGWYDAAAGGNMVYDANGKCVTGAYWDAGKHYINNGDLAVYAQWTASEYTLTRDPNGGTYLGKTAVSSATLTYDAGYYWDIGESTRTGYTFRGWFTEDGVMVYDAEGKRVTGDYWDAGKHYINAGDLAVYAQWTNNLYNLTINPNGGKYNGKSKTVTLTKALKYDSESSGSISVPERTGYTFEGWFDAATGGNMVYDEEGKCVAGDYWTADGKYVHADNLTVYAQWSANVYALIRDPNGGVYQDRTTAVELEEALEYNAGYYWNIGVPKSEDGYVFAGWFDAETDGNMVYDEEGKCVTGSGYWTADKKYVYDGDLTVYAQWKGPMYALTINPNGGTYQGDSGPTVMAGALMSGSDDCNSIEVPVRSGWGFVGWFTEDGVMVYDAEGNCVAGDYWGEDGTYIYEGDLTVYAYWASAFVKYNLTINPNGGTYQGKTAATVVNDALSFNSDDYSDIGVPTRSGSRFLGWFSDKTGGVMVYDEKGKFFVGAHWTVDGRYCYSGDLTVYAHWSGGSSQIVEEKSEVWKGSAKFAAEPLPEWAAGTFDGVVQGVGASGMSGVVTLTVAANGEITGKMLEAGKTWILSGAILGKVGDSSSAYCASVSGRSGENSFSGEMTLALDEVAPCQRGVISCPATSVSPGLTAWQNVWKTGSFETFAEAPVIVTPDGVTLKFSASGAVTAKYGERSCSATLIPAADGTFSCFLYFPPKAGLSDGYVAEVILMWDGSAFVPAERHDQ